MSEPERTPPPEAAEPARPPLRGVQAPVAAIASNVSLDRRVAPDIEETSVIEDMYAFAEHLRAGSGKR